MMNIHLRSEYANLSDIGVNNITKNWVGIFKLHMKYPPKDGIAFLKSEQVFVT